MRVDRRQSNCLRLGRGERRDGVERWLYQRGRERGGGALAAVQRQLVLGGKQPGGQHGILLLEPRPLREQGWLGSSVLSASNARDPPSTSQRDAAVKQHERDRRMRRGTVAGNASQRRAAGTVDDGCAGDAREAVVS